MFKSRGAVKAAASRTFPAILTDAGKVSKVGLMGSVVPHLTSGVQSTDFSRAFDKGDLKLGSGL